MHYLHGDIVIRHHEPECFIKRLVNNFKGYSPQGQGHNEGS